MSSSERAQLEALAADWLDRAKSREPSVRQIYETCAEELLRMLPVAPGDNVLVIHGPWKGWRGIVARVSNDNCAIRIDGDPKPQERHHRITEVTRRP